MKKPVIKSTKTAAFVVSVLGLSAVSSPAWALVATIPEPNIIALFGLGAVAAILIARFKGKK